MVITKSNTQLLYIITVLKTLKLMGLYRFCHETWQFFKDLELTIIEDYDFFQIPRAGWLFDSEHFQRPETGGSLVLNFFIYLKLAGITKIKYLAPHWCKPELNHTTDSIGNLIIIEGKGSHFVWRKLLPKVPSNFTFQKSSKKI
jgi:hypothetical protein